MQKDLLADYSLLADPLESFRQWYQAALTTEENPAAMSLATASKNAAPSVRIVLFKGLSEKGFKLYGHDDSQKGLEMRSNPQAALAFFWANAGRQVRVTGVIEQMSEEQTREYFYSRALESQVASSISQQSRPIASRAQLEQKFTQALKEAQQAGSVLMPKSWRGFVLIPETFEFFIYREHRLNDRFFFEKKANQWQWCRLQP